MEDANLERSIESAPEPGPHGSRPPRRRERHSAWIIVLVIVAATATALVVVYTRVNQRRATLLRVQEECLRYERPADQVVYEEEPGRAAALLARGSEYAAVPTGSSTGPAIAGHVPAPWVALWRWMQPQSPQPPPGAVLFLHERQSASGHRGLVCVQADRAGRRLRVTFIHPGSTRLDPIVVTDVAVVPQPQEGLLILRAGPDPFAAKLLPAEGDPAARADLRFFAGQPDANDPTYFTIRYESEGRSGVVAMWVQDEQTIHYVDRRFAAR